MHFGFVLDSWNIDLWEMDLLDTNLDIDSRRLEDMSSSRLQDVFSVTVFSLPRRLEDVLEDVFKTSSRRLGRRKIVTLKAYWRSLQGDVLETNNCLLGYFCLHTEWKNITPEKLKFSLRIL